MDQQHQEILRSIISELQLISRRIKELEKEAGEALYEQGDNRTYKDKMTQKALLLVSLSKKLPRHDLLSAPLASFIKDNIGGISFSAEKALNLDSVFYMSALLYPEDYREGDNNDLDTLIKGLQEWL